MGGVYMFWLICAVLALGALAAWAWDRWGGGRAYEPLDASVLLASQDPFPWLRRKVMSFQDDGSVTFVFHHTGRGAQITLDADISAALEKVWVGDRQVTVIDEAVFIGVVKRDVWARLEDLGWTLP